MKGMEITAETTKETDLAFETASPQTTHCKDVSVVAVHLDL